MPLHDLHITLHMVSSLDGYIAKPDNSLSWFETAHPYAKGVESPDPEAFLSKIDAYIMGAHTYEFALELEKSYGWAYGDKPTYVLSSRKLPSHRSNISFFSGNLTDLVSRELKPSFKNVWVVGGAKLARSFILQNLLDEIRISILPILLGSGLTYFDYIGQEKALRLNDAVAYKNGMVELCYALVKEKGK